MKIIKTSAYMRLDYLHYCDSRDYRDYHISYIIYVWVDFRVILLAPLQHFQWYIDIKTPVPEKCHPATIKPYLLGCDYPSIEMVFLLQNFTSDGIWKFHLRWYFYLKISYQMLFLFEFFTFSSLRESLSGVLKVKGSVTLRRFNKILIRCHIGRSGVWQLN